MRNLLIGVVCAVAVFGAIGSVVRASGEAFTGSNAVSGQINTPTLITDLQVGGTGNDTIPVKLRVTNGSLQMTTTTGLAFTGGTTGATLYFSGTRSDVNAALASLRYTRTGIGTDTLEASLVNPGEVFFPDTGHLYEYVASTLTWNNAKSAAEGRSKYGATGYLTTITSQAENEFVSARLSDAGWMGASDVSSEGAWRWVTGPESGTQFWQGTGTGNTVGGNYANWNSGEPNDSGSNEDCGQFLAGSSGKWNDLPCGGTTLPGYVVEYGSTGNMPAVAAKNVTITVSDTTAPTTPGAPTTTSPTTNRRPTWTWSGSTDSGVGLANPAYTIQWSQDNTFTNGVGSTTSNTTSYAHTADLADGRWYVRIRATDLSNNASPFSATASVVVDTTAPTTPSLNLSTTQTSSNTPTITWTAASDGGAGLGSPAYTVQWATNASFSTQLGSGTTNNTNLVIPSALSDGVWYFRVSAKDTLNNQSAWSTAATMRIDTTSPTTPGAPTTGTPTNNAKPTWTWTAASDGGAGLGSPAYSVVWSQDSTFMSGTSSATSNSPTFTHSGSLPTGTWYFHVQAIDDVNNTSAFSATGSVVIDTIPPVIANINIATPLASSQTIEWTSSKAASSQITYGPTVDYDSTSALADTSPRVTSHTMTLTGLVSCTLYHYQILAVDAVGNQSTSNDGTFITAGCAGTAPVIDHTDTLIAANTGGSLSLSNSDGSLTLQVPAQYSVADADFQIKQVGRSETLQATGVPSGVALVGQLYDIRAVRDTDTLTSAFSRAISITMSYNPDALGSIIADTLAIYHWTANTGWQKTNACTHNPNAHTVTCTTTSFSTFALFGVRAVEPVAPTMPTTTRVSLPLTIAASNPVVDVAPEQTAEHAPTSGTGHDQTVHFEPADRHDTTTDTNDMWQIVSGLLVLLGILWILAFRRRKKAHKA